jgi:hypothetical protein
MEQKPLTVIKLSSLLVLTKKRIEELNQEAIDKYCFKVDELFLNTIADLKKKMKSKKQYDHIRACGLLRHLLVDSPTLLSNANRGINLKILFKISKETLQPNWYLCYHKTHNDSTKEVGIHGFLSYKILSFAGDYYTVKDIIHSGSTFMGGVHSVFTKEAKVKKFLLIDDKEICLRQNVISDIIISIGGITLKALAPLEKVIKGRTLTGGF